MGTHKIRLASRPTVPCPQPGVAATAKGRDAVAYWRKGMPLQNFGDYLSETLYEALCEPASQEAPSHDFEQLFLIGSVISDWHIRTALKAVDDDGRVKIGFWGCGMRNETPIAPRLTARCRFMGVRGPLTRDGLGLPPETPLGDPGLLMPLIYPPKVDTARVGGTLCIPHFADPRPTPDLLRMSGADSVLRPAIQASRHAVLETIDAIAGAEFVLAGALHGAIIAAAYGVPFAYFDSGYINVPFKWRDFAASLEIPTVFATDVVMGRRIHDAEIRDAVRMPCLEDLLRCAPIPAPDALLRRARTHDATRSKSAWRSARGRA